MNEALLRETLRDIIDGTIVKRSKHLLVYNGTNVTPLFLEELQRKNFLPLRVDEIEIEKGERVPAFYVEHNTAYFGWIFWEKFTELRLRKLFGSVVRNAKGDWQIQLSPKSEAIVYANITRRIPMDIDRPFEWL